MRVVFVCLGNFKIFVDYGLVYNDVDIIIDDNVWFSVWEILIVVYLDWIVIFNYFLIIICYGLEVGFDGVFVEFLFMVKYMYDVGYNVVMYDYCG